MACKYIKIPLEKIAFFFFYCKKTPTRSERVRVISVFEGKEQNTVRLQLSRTMAVSNITEAKSK